MTNRIAIVLGLIIVGAILLDVFLYGSEHLIFLGKKFAELVEWIAFWR
ncbi:hypothetical protein SuNHUV7_35120 (plasmid) [Pseudoseohaeicola sp. NH-UV-7]|jgi:hypothetical protein|nr:hypothetical protein [Sulfitobacter sp. JL08]